MIALMRRELSRPSKEELMTQIAGLVATRSTCARAQVGAVITTVDMTNIVAMGYNGSARTLPNRCERDTPGDCGCVHAEANAVIKAPYDNGPLWLFTTTTPCADCAKLVINSRVSRVYAYSRYRLAAGAELLRAAGVPVYVWDDGAFRLWDEL